MDKYKKLTNEVGAPMPDNENAITAGPRGPVVMQDVWLMEKMAHFNREVIPERRMHAKGWGAYGKLTVTHDVSKYTKAKVLQPNAVTDLFIRFSTVAGERGAADAERDIRGVAVKFYTEDGNYGGAPAYTPNSLGVWTAQPEVSEPPLDLEGAMYRYDPKDDLTDDCFRAGGNLWRVMTEDKKQILTGNTVCDMASVTVNIKYRHAAHCYLADTAYGERFAKAAGLDIEKVKELSKLTNDELNKATLSSNM